MVFPDQGSDGPVESRGRWDGKIGRQVSKAEIEKKGGKGRTRAESMRVGVRSVANDQQSERGGCVSCRTSTSVGGCCPGWDGGGGANLEVSAGSSQGNFGCKRYFDSMSPRDDKQ